MKISKIEKEKLRKNRVSKTINQNNKQVLRLSVFCSNKHIYAQIVDDKAGKTITSASDLEKEIKVEGLKKTAIAALVGENIAKKAKIKKVSKVIFDRGSKLYHGRVAALAEGARKQGLDF